MNQTLYQMAYRNVKKYKKHYLFAFIIILCLTIFLITYSIVWDNHYETVKAYHQDQYGYWYAMMHINENDQKEIEKYIQTYDKDARYGYYYEQGVYENGKIGNIDQEVFKLCHLQIIQGHYPKNKHEIMISSALSNRFKINQTIELAIKNHQKQNYKIVGIVENSQAKLFPWIYTGYQEGDICWIVADREFGSEGHIILDNDVQIYFHDLIINEYGYSSNQIAVKNILSVQQIIGLAEIIVLVIFVFIALSFTSLKRRLKEFALLRGIGMTTRQLFLMVIYENIFITLLALVIGVILSLGLSYGIMLYFKEIYGYFFYHINMIKVITYTMILLICIIISITYPIIASAKQSLSGSFEGQTFKHLQIRYHHLKYQSKWRIALRELYVYKKLPICLFCIFGLLIIYYSGTFVKPKEKVVPRFESLHYIEYKTNDEEQIKIIQDLQIPHTFVFRFFNLPGVGVDGNTKQIIETHMIWNDSDEVISLSGGIYCIDDKQWLNNSQIHGNTPQKDNELLLGTKATVIGIKEFYENDNNLYAEGYEIGDLSIGDTFYVDGKDYHIVGSLPPNEQVTYDEGKQESIYFLPLESPWDSSAALYVSPHTFETWLTFFQDENEMRETKKILRTYYETDEEKDKYIQQVYFALPTIEIIDSDEALLNSQEIDILVDIDPSMLILPVIVSFVLCYYLNKNQMLNDIQDYGLYKLIGMTNKELMIKQFYKAIFMTLCILGFEMIWIIIFNLYYHLLIIPIKECLISILIVLFIVIFIYCVPLYHILKDDMILSLKGQE